MIPINTSNKRWLKITLILLFLIIAAIVTYGYIIYSNLLEQKESGYDKSIEQVLRETSLTKIDTKYKYFGKDNYHIFWGTTDDKDKKLVFFPLDKDNEIITLDDSEVISKQDVEQQWKNKCQSCTLMKVRPAMDDGTPLWEFTYKSKQDRLILEYVSIKDGSDYEKYRFNQMFK